MIKNKPKFKKNDNNYNYHNHDNSTHIIPFSTDVWSRSKDDIEIVLLGKLDELDEIVLSFKIKDSLLWLMDIPCYITALKIIGFKLANY